MKIIRLLVPVGILLCHTAAYAADGVDMVVKRVLDNKLQLQVPQSFMLMGEDKRMKFPKDRRPTLAGKIVMDMIAVRLREFASTINRPAGTSKPRTRKR